MNEVFKQVLTVEQFKSRVSTVKLNIKKLVEKGTKAPVFYNDENGNITTVQKRIITDDAGNIIGSCSRKIAEEIEANQSITAKALAVGVREYTDRTTGEVRDGYTLFHPVDNTEVTL